MNNLWIVWNIIVFFVYGIDKLKAIRGGWRISEKTLLITAFCLGGLGAYAGMQVFRHKTKKKKFTILVPVAIVFNIAVWYAVREIYILL